MEFRAAHGCYDLEQKVGGNYEVDVTLRVEGGDAVEADDVTGTVNYVEVYETVREQMATPSRIIEHVALRIANAICTRFPQVMRAEVTVSKLAPPLGGKATKVSVTLEG
jgi:dihydroneopterin aldolase